MTKDSTSQIAILVCDTPIEGIASSFGDFGDCAIDLLTNEVAHCGKTDSIEKRFDLIKYQISFEKSDDPSIYLPKLNELYRNLHEQIISGVLKGVLLTGSRSDAFDNENPWIARLDEFISRVLYQLDNFPIVGLCFGHQILAKNLGCKVGRNLPEHGWEVGTTTINLNKDIVSIENSPFLNVLTNADELSDVSKLSSTKINDHLNLVIFHRDVVFGLPPTSTLSSKKTKFQSIGSTSKCSIQGLITESGPIKILTFQGHPEFCTAMALRLLQRDVDLNIIDQNQFEKCTYNTKVLDNQGPLIGKVINNFFNSFNP